MKALFLILTLMFSFTANAGFEGLQSGNSLKTFNRINCSTGLTCTRGANGLFTMVSSPTLVAPLTLESAEVLSNAVDDVVQIASNDSDLVFSVYSPLATNGDATVRLIADASADNGDDWQIQHDGATNNLLFQNDTSGSQVTKLTLSTAGAISVVGDLSGDGGDQLVGFLQEQVAATATTITAAQCGSTFYNSGAIEIELPEASTVVGCRLSFVTLNAANFDIDPDAADQILVLTDAAGDKIRNATLGNSVTIQAVSASQWVVIGEKGTWSDAN